MFWNRVIPDALFRKKSLLKLFGLSDIIESHLVENMQERFFHKDDVVVREGDQGNSLFWVASGNLAVFKRDQLGRDLEISRMEADDFFGEISFLNAQQRTATVIALNDCRLFEIKKKRSVEYLVLNTPQLHAEFKLALRRRLKNDEAKLHKVGKLKPT